jgi:pSer/pThr/pTyr-binding forkhead associated (FHA) protein/Mg-chelatase subunit ChlD
MMSVKSLLFGFILLLSWQVGPVQAADGGADTTAATSAVQGQPVPGDTDSGTATTQPVALPPSDVVLVLDNSGSMKKNDPEFLTSQAVREFVSQLDEDTRLAIVIFDQDVRLAMPLTPISEQSREQITKSLAQINYKGLFTDSPAAIERAIYELKNNGRPDSRKSIIFMTDGIVDTGNTEKDVEKSKWLREDLAPDAADAKIRIFGIAFTEDADFQLIQTLAQKTDGEYFRALQPKDLHGVFERIYSIMQQPQEEKAAAPEQATAVPAPTVQETPPVVIHVPQSPPQSLGREDRTRSIIIIVAAIILIIALLVMIMVLIRRGRELNGYNQDDVVEAYLNDIHGYTSRASYRLGSKPTMLGRVAGKDTAHLEYIVIPESTIGRRHALIEYKDFSYWIVDQGSINGTFVNDVPISSEVRLKHGDIIRLHKLEFEFVMPDLDDASMTELSHTVLSQEINAHNNGATRLKSNRDSASSAVDIDLDLDFSGVDTESAAESGDNITLMQGAYSGKDVTAPQQGEYDSEDETLMPGNEDAIASEQAETDKEDETLLPGDFETPEEEETLRQDSSDESIEDILDMTGDNKKKENRD